MAGGDGRMHGRINGCIWCKHRVVWFGLLGLLVACLFHGWMDGWMVCK